MKRIIIGLMRIDRKSKEEVYEDSLNWAKKYSKSLQELIEKDVERVVYS